MQAKFIHKTDLEQMADDIVTAAEIAEAPYDRNVIREVLHGYKDFFSGAPTSFVTSTKPKGKRALSVRYVQLQERHDPYETALKRGFLSGREHPIYDLTGQIRSEYPVLGYGVDMDAAHGLSKIWIFFEVPQPVKTIHTMASFPNSIKNYRDYFSKHNLNMFQLFALDYRKKTTNIYFMVTEPELLTPDKIAEMIGDLGFKIPSREKLEYCSKAITIYYTFDWTNPGVQRLCFGVTALDPGQVPTHLHPLMEKFVDKVPILSEDRYFIYGFTSAPDGDYLKIENDYTGSMIGLMQRGTQAEVMMHELKKKRDRECGQSESSPETRKWEPGIHELFEKIAGRIPGAFRAVVKPLLSEVAGQKCMKRDGGCISEADLTTALLEITPEQFKDDAIVNLNACGVDVDRYLKPD